MSLPPAWSSSFGNDFIPLTNVRTLDKGSGVVFCVKHVEQSIDKPVNHSWRNTVAIFALFPRSSYQVMQTSKYDFIENTKGMVIDRKWAGWCRFFRLKTLLNSWVLTEKLSLSLKNVLAVTSPITRYLNTAETTSHLTITEFTLVIKTPEVC